MQKTLSKVLEDIQLVFDNCRLYNESGMKEIHEDTNLFLTNDFLKMRRSLNVRKDWKDTFAR